LLIIVLAEAAESTTKARHGDDCTDEREGSLGSLLGS
jgi:hypothetical protein